VVLSVGWIHDCSQPYSARLHLDPLDGITALPVCSGLRAMDLHWDYIGLHCLGWPLVITAVITCIGLVHGNSLH